MKINFFGCSFTEGGGLNNFDYFNYNTGKNFDINNNILEENIEVNQFKNEHRYSTIVGNLMNIDVENYAIGCNSNEGILKNIIDVINDKNTKNEDIFIIQTTFLARKFYWYEPIEEFISVNASNVFDWPFRNKKEYMPLHELHNLNLKYCHNEEYEAKKLIQNIKIYNSYFKELGIKIFWMPWCDLTTETNKDKILEFNKNIVKEIPNIFLFQNTMCMGEFVSSNKLLIKDKFIKSNDNHKSIEGHKLVAEKLVEYLKNNI